MELADSSPLAPAPGARAAADRYHVVLVGIDAYAAAPPLGGCVNDVDAIQTLLLKRLGVRANQITRLAAGHPDPAITRPTAITTLPPTRQNIVAALRRIGSDLVQHGDRVLFYYTGHGTHRVVRLQGGRYYREALVPADNVAFDSEGNEVEQLIFDWELSALLARIAARTPAVTVVLDCCCSAGATRGDSQSVRPTDVARFLPDPNPAVPVRLPLAQIAECPTEGSDALAHLSGSAGCMVIAACFDDEVARESFDPGAPQGPKLGMLTRALLSALQTVADDRLPTLRWGEIWREVASKLFELNPNQHSWCSNGLARQVFGGPPERGDVGYAVRFDSATSTYSLDAGSLTGVTEDALVALYPPMPPPPADARFPPFGTPADLAARIGVLKVTSSTRSTATAVATSSQPTPAMWLPGTRGRLAKPGLSERLIVALRPFVGELAERLKKSPFLEIAGAGQPGLMTLVLHRDSEGKDAWEIVDELYGAGAGRVARLPRLPAAMLDAAVAFVEHYYHFTAPLRLARRCSDLPHALRITLLDAAPLEGQIAADLADDPPLKEISPTEGATWDLKAGRVDSAGAWTQSGDAYCIRVENTSDEPLRVWLFNCDSSGRALLFKKQEHLDKKSRKTFWMRREAGCVPIGAALDGDETYNVDRYVAVGTTNPDATLDFLEVETTFEEILTRRFRGEPASRPTHSWTSSIAVVRMAI